MRVIAGRLGGRRLDAPDGRDTRPTSDRVREALFSVLADLEGARVLDLYAGTGALGIEALSRGAARATFVESARGAILVLRKNLASLELEASSQVVASAVARATIEGPFDLVFADPPYARVGEAASALAALVSRGALAPSARVVLEHATRDAAPSIEGLAPRPTRTYGDTSVTIYDVPDAPS